MNVLRTWATCSPSCRLMALRMTAQPLDIKFFSIAARNTGDLSHFFSETGLRRPANADISSKFSNLLSRHSSFPRRTHPAPSRLGWYRESTGWRGQPVKRPSGSSGAGRTSFDPQSPSLLKRFRRWFDQVPPEFLVWGIIGLNGAVFFAWQYAKDRAKHGDPSLYFTLSRNVQNSWRNIREGRVWCVLASAFSHSNVGHIFLNCFTFYFMAPPIVHLIGNTSFLALYFFGGISCSMLSLFVNKTISQREGSSHGASGAIFAVMSFFACVSPNTTFLIFGILPCPAWAVVTGFFVWDGFSALVDRPSMIDGAGHVGGIIAGVVYYLAKRRLFF